MIPPTGVRTSSEYGPPLDTEAEIAVLTQQVAHEERTAKREERAAERSALCAAEKSELDSLESRASSLESNAWIGGALTLGAGVSEIGGVFSDGKIASARWKGFEVAFRAGEKVHDGFAAAHASELDADRQRCEQGVKAHERNLEEIRNGDAELRDVETRLMDAARELQGARDQARLASVRG